MSDRELQKSSIVNRVGGFWAALLVRTTKAWPLLLQMAAFMSGESSTSREPGTCPTATSQSQVCQAFFIQISLFLNYLQLCIIIRGKSALECMVSSTVVTGNL